MIKVLIVEDSPVVMEFLRTILESDPEIEVIAFAMNGLDAVDAVKRYAPNVVTMDINMPKMNGFEATRRIMEEHPTPIVIVSGSWDTREVATTFHALEAGAVAVLPRPFGVDHPEFESSTRELIQTVKLMSEVRVVRRWPRKGKENNSQSVIETPALPKTSNIQVVAIGASTGGPSVLQTILTELPKTLPVPVLVVQHIAQGFIHGLADWLEQTTGFPIHVAIHGEPLLPGHAYVAPDGQHMGITSGNRIDLSNGESEYGMRPAVSFLFRSVADVYKDRALGVLLTGMGKDGAKELKQLKSLGAVTIAQDQQSAVVFGMPGEASKMDAAVYTLNPIEIAGYITKIVAHRHA